MSKKKIKRTKGEMIVVTNTKTGEKFSIQLDDTLDLTETGISKFLEKAFKFFKFESYLMFFSQEEIPQIMLKAFPEQMQKMLVPILMRYPDVSEQLAKAIVESQEMLEQKKKEIHYH